MQLISRRTVLRGLGATVALPLLDAMIPEGILGAAPAAARAPLRLAFLYVPNGIHMQDWTPKTEGAGFALTPTLEPLEPFRDQLTVLTGLTLDKARPNGDGPGDHARAMAAFLTGCQPRKTSGANIKAGISVDQLAAQHAGKETRFASLEIGCEGGKVAGNCDSGYSCAYSSTISWRGESTPVAKEVNPRLVFDRLFAVGGVGDPATAKRDHARRSILDFVAEDARSLKTRLGTSDQRKLDEYLTGVREIEQRIAKTDKIETQGVPAGAVRPSGIPRNYEEHLKLLADMLVLAFQTNQTRVATFVFANEGSNRPYRDIGISEGHHELSHHGWNKAKQEKIQQINLFHTRQLACFLGKLKAIREGGRPLLDNCLIVYGSGNSDGNRHNHDDLPILLLGKGGGTIQPGRHLRLEKDTPLMNLYLSLLDRMGVSIPRFGDSTGRLPSLDG
jgi:hypothetical protein